MKQYIALLRGINVGGKNKVEMKKLKVCFERAGMEEVSTYINTGNVLFKSKETHTAKLVKTLEAAINKEFDLEIKVLIRSREQILQTANALKPSWSNDKAFKTDVMFLWEEFDSPAVLKEIAINTEVDTVSYVPGALIWHLDRKDYNKSGMNKLIGTKLYKHMTIRNCNTLRKLVSLLD